MLISWPYGSHVVAIHPVMRTRLVFPIEWMTFKWKLLLINCGINLTLSNESGHLINQNEYGQWLTRVCFVLIGSITQIPVRLLQLARTFTLWRYSSNISNTRVFQTLRCGLKKLGVAEFFFKPTSNHIYPNLLHELLMSLRMSNTKLSLLSLSPPPFLLLFDPIFGILYWLSAFHFCSLSATKWEFSYYCSWFTTTTGQKDIS